MVLGLFSRGRFIRNLWLANIRAAVDGERGMVGKNRRHGSAFPVGVSIRPIAPQRPSSRGPRERSATNANRRLSAKAPAADNLGPGILDCPPECVVA